MYLTRCYPYFFKVLATKLDILQNRNISVVGFYRWSYSKILPRPGTITFTNDSIIIVPFQPAAMFKQSVQLWGILHTWSWIGRVLLSVWGRNYSLTIHWSFMQRRYVSYDQIKQQIVSFFVFKANEQPPSRDSAMALRHNVQSPTKTEACNVMEGVRDKRRGTKPPTSPRDRTSPPNGKFWLAPMWCEFVNADP